METDLFRAAVERPGSAVDPDSVLTLALLNTGLAGLDADIALAEILISAGVYNHLDILYDQPLEEGYRGTLTRG